MPDLPDPLHPNRYFEWTRRLVPPLGFYAEHWRSPEEDPDYPALVEKFGDEDRAGSEVGMLRMHLLREVVTAAGGVLYTVSKIERLLGELQTYVQEKVPRLPEDKPWPEFGYGVSHPLVVEASFEFVNLLSWLRAIDERLDRPHRPGQQDVRVGLLPALADRPLRSRVEALVKEFWGAPERKLANYVLHAGVVPAPLEGAQITEEHEVRLQVPDRPARPIETRWHLTYEEERDALTLAQEAARDVESLVEGLLDAFEREKRAIEEERGYSSAPSG